MTGVNYYKVLVASNRYHGDEALTYSSEENLAVGQIVAVPMQNQQVAGVIESVVDDKPSFTTRPISKVITQAGLPPQLIELVHWLKDYYPSSLGSLLQLLLPSTLLQTSRTDYRPRQTKQTALPPLTTEQVEVVKRLQKIKGSALLHGDTGSGKTRVYQEIAKQALDDNQSVIVLTPEIGLTPQLAGAFEASFPDVVTLHSNLTPAERRKRWLAVLESNVPQVVVGPRSALFAPLKNVGLIVLDEVHDSAYKQEQQPYYQTSRVAAVLGQLHGARVILGSATPPVADYYTFTEKKLPIIRMDQQALPQKTDTTVELVDISQRDNFTRSPYLSQPMLEAIGKTLASKEQALIFLNRRGTARLVMCEQCGWTAKCPRCDLALTYHGDAHQMRCHVCNYHESAPGRCPECGHTDIAYTSIGTKTIVSELERLFPDARIRRFDTDLKKGERLEEAYGAIRKGEVDILVGTQMLAKGLDLPGLSLVGVVVADTSLYIPDYSAEEHSYQLLSQIIGRVGRGHRHGAVIIQTYHPDNPTLQAAISRDYESFYEKQRDERQQFGYPPFTYLLKLVVSRATSASAETTITALAEKIAHQRLPIEIVGPSPAFYEKTHGKYHWQVIIKAKQRSVLLRIIKDLPANISYDIDPNSLV